MGRVLLALLAACVLVPIWVGLAWTLLRSTVGVMVGLVLGLLTVGIAVERWLGIDLGLGLGRAGDDD